MTIGDLKARLSDLGCPDETELKLFALVDGGGSETVEMTHWMRYSGDGKGHETLSFILARKNA